MMLDESTKFVEAPGEPIPKGESNITLGAFFFSGSKSAAADGLPVAAATTNGDGLIPVRGAGAIPSRSETADRSAPHLISPSAPVSTFPGADDVHTSEVAGAGQPGQTEPELLPDLVRGFDTAFTRNSPPADPAFTLNPEWASAHYGIRWPWEPAPTELEQLIAINRWRLAP